MAGKHYIIATQTGYLVDEVTGYPYEFHSKGAAVEALAAEVKEAAQACRRSHKTCSVVGSARKGSVQIKIGGRQGYHLWQRYVINERPGARKLPREAGGVVVNHATRKRNPAQLDREIAEALTKAPEGFKIGDVVQFRWEPDTGGVIRGWDSNGEAVVVTLRGERSVSTDALRHVHKSHVDRIRRAVERGSQHTVKAHATRKSTLTRAQLAALRTFAHDNGHNWKSALNHAWSTGDWSNDLADNSGLLQQVRNMFGPRWLVKFSFKSLKTYSAWGQPSSSSLKTYSAWGQPSSSSSVRRCVLFQDRGMAPFRTAAWSLSGPRHGP